VCDGWVAGAKYDVGSEVDVELLLEGGLHIDLSQHTETLFAELVTDSFHGLFVR
jgi:hypothetical protein